MGKQKSTKRGTIKRREGTRDFWAQKEAKAQHLKDELMKRHGDGKWCEISSHLSVHKPPPHDELLILTPGPDSVGVARQTVHNKKKQHEAVVAKLAQHEQSLSEKQTALDAAEQQLATIRRDSIDSCIPWPPIGRCRERAASELQRTR